MQSPLISSQALVAFTCAALIAAVTIGLCLSDGMSWPRSLMAGLGAGGAALVGITQLTS
ncbi:hypothetical protein ACQPZZ_26050 [Microbispora sp. CA-135349]|uniref:hypothetical protein n=1 Tax=Microbispora sp. CA-135349 TaxID=3239953 RepID=UPI003D89DDF4